MSEICVLCEAPESEHCPFIGRLNGACRIDIGKNDWDWHPTNRFTPKREEQVMSNNLVAGDGLHREESDPHSVGLFTSPATVQPSGGENVPLTFEEWWQGSGRLNHYKGTPERLARLAWNLGVEHDPRCQQLSAERDELRKALVEAVASLSNLVSVAPHEGEGAQRALACMDARKVIASAKALLENGGGKEG